MATVEARRVKNEWMIRIKNKNATQTKAAVKDEGELRIEELSAMNGGPITRPYIPHEPKTKAGRAGTQAAE